MSSIDTKQRNEKEGNQQQRAKSQPRRSYKKAIFIPSNAELEFHTKINLQKFDKHISTSPKFSASILNSFVSTDAILKSQTKSTQNSILQKQQSSEDVQGNFIQDSNQKKISHYPSAMTLRSGTMGSGSFFFNGPERFEGKETMNYFDHSSFNPLVNTTKSNRPPSPMMNNTVKAKVNNFFSQRRNNQQTSIQENNTNKMVELLPNKNSSHNIADPTTSHSFYDQVTSPKQSNLLTHQSCRSPVSSLKDNIFKSIAFAAHTQGDVAFSKVMQVRVKDFDSQKLVRKSEGRMLPKERFSEFLEVRDNLQKYQLWKDDHAIKSKQIKLARNAFRSGITRMEGPLTENALIYEEEHEQLMKKEKEEKERIHKRMGNIEKFTASNPTLGFDNSTHINLPTKEFPNQVELFHHQFHTKHRELSDIQRNAKSYDRIFGNFTKQEAALSPAQIQRQKYLFSKELAGKTFNIISNSVNPTINFVTKLQTVQNGD